MTPARTRFQNAQESARIGNLNSRYRIMSVVLSPGAIAGPRALHYLRDHQQEVDREGVTFWARGHGVELSSDSYNSCVGLVLHGDVDGYGAVAHFWAPKQDLERNTRRDAHEVTESYMRWLLQETGGYAGDDVEALVFGGEALETGTGAEFTRPRIELLQTYLEERWEMRVVVATVGSRWVKLDLVKQADKIEDRVTLQNGLIARKPHEFEQSPKSKTRGTHRRIGSTS